MKLYEFKMPHPVCTLRGAANSLKEAIAKACEETIFRPCDQHIDELEVYDCDDIDVQDTYTGRVYHVRYRTMQLDF